MNKLKYAWVTFLPMLFMFTTTLTASYELFWIFVGKSASVVPAEALTLKLDASLVAVMALLAVVALIDSVYKWYGYLSGKIEIATSEVVEWAGDLEVH